MGVFYSKNGEDDPAKPSYGYIPDHYLMSEKKLKISGVQMSKMRKNCNLSENFLDVYDQKRFHSSTANAIASVIEYNFNICPEHERKVKRVSRMHIFNLGRQIQDGNESLQKNTGTSIRETLKQVNKYGIVDTSSFPYSVGYSTYVIKSNNIKGYYRGRFKYRKVHKDLSSFKTCLSVLKQPIIFGFSVYDSFHDKLKWDNDGVMPIPKSTEKLIGLQTAVAVGYSHKRKAFLIRNSWGREWKNDGYFFMPFDYFTSKNCSSFWTVELEIDPIDEEFVPESDLERSESDRRSKKRTRRKHRKRRTEESDSEEDPEPKEIVIDLSDKCHIKDS